MAKLLILLAELGESPAEIRGFARSLHAHCVKVALGGEALDVCGTGGVTQARFNVSTTAAFVLAAGGTPVAKHGNKGSRRPNGSFDLLDHLKIAYGSDPAVSARLFQAHKLCFLFARYHHPAMRHLAATRAKLGRRSIFNLVGPLSNPAGAGYQIVGAADRKVAEKLAAVFTGLTRQRVLVLHGHPGLDEFSLSGATETWLVEAGQVTQRTFTPAELGFRERPYESLPGGDVEVNAGLFLRLMAGETCDGLADLVALNAGAALWVYGAAPSIRAGAEQARADLASGRVRAFFEAYPKI